MSFQQLYIAFGFTLFFIWGSWIIYKGKAKIWNGEVDGLRARIWGVILIIGAFNWVAFWYSNLILNSIFVAIIGIILILYFIISIYKRINK